MTRMLRRLLTSLSLAVLAACSGGGGGDGSAGGETVTISGTIGAGSNMVLDTDTNDPESVFATNNTPATAQIIGNPALVGGFVTFSPTRRAGERYVDRSDQDDIFVVDLAAGQSVVLENAQPLDADLDLYLFDAGGNLVDASVGVSRFETVRAKGGGRYYVDVYAYDGASNYILTVGTGTVPASTLGLSGEFVGGEAVVRLAPAAAKSGTTIQGLGLSVRAGAPERPMLLGFSPAQTVAAFADRRSALPDGLRVEASQAARLRTLEQIKALRKRPEVLSADPNFVLRPSAAPTDPFYRLQWHYPLINLPQAWDVTTGTPASGEVVVAVVDTGVYLNHADLASSLLRNGGQVVGFDFIRDVATANDGNGIDPDANDPGDNSTPGSSSWHGSHVAGTIAAVPNNGVGVAGVSWGARIMPVRVLGKGGGSSYDVIQGIRYAAGLSNDSGTFPTRRADVINLSLGCLNCRSSAEQALIDEVRAAGVIVVAAAGNENTGLPSYPAAYDGVVSVAAVGIDSSRAPYSNFGTSVDVAAPGGNTAVDLNSDGYADGVLSTLVGSSGSSEYGFYQGTSMAAPHVAGVVALMKAVHPGLRPGDFDALLASGAITSDLGAAGRDDQFGWGLIDAAKAVLEARRLAAGGTTAIVSATPARLDFGSSLSSATFQLNRLGGGGLSVTGVSSDATWLSVSAASVDGDRLGSYSATVNRANLSVGSYAATLSVSLSSGAQVRIPVSMLVTINPVQVNTGHYWVLLMDQDYTLIGMLDSSGSGGSYPFRFDGVPKGSYYLFAGTDSDWDDLICDDGEACGAYPTIAQPVLFEVTGDRSGLDFSVGLNLSPGSKAASAASDGTGTGFSRSANNNGKGLGHGR